MAHVVRAVVDGLGHAVHTVFHHAPAFKRHQGKRQAPVKVFTRLELVVPVFGKKQRPVVKTLVIKCCGISGIELVDLMVQP